MKPYLISTLCALLLCPLLAASSEGEAPAKPSDTRTSASAVSLAELDRVTQVEVGGFVDTVQFVLDEADGQDVDSDGDGDSDELLPVRCPTSCNCAGWAGQSCLLPGGGPGTCKEDAGGWSTIQLCYRCGCG